MTFTFLSLKGKSIDIWSWLFPNVRLNHIKSDRQVSLGLNITWTWRMMTFSIQTFELLSWKICLIRKLLNRNQGPGLFSKNIPNGLYLLGVKCCLYLCKLSKLPFKRLPPPRGINPFLSYNEYYLNCFMKCSY